jgi:serine/threonine protein kinase
MPPKKAYHNSEAAEAVTGSQDLLLVLGVRYKIQRKLGEGAFSTVYLCAHETTGAQVAIKKATVPDTQIYKVHDEMALMEHIGHHPCIVTPVGNEVSRVMGQYSVVYVMEYYPITVIQDMAQSEKRRQQYSLASVVQIISSVFSAVQHLHSRDPPVAHRDLKPENILKSEDGRFVLCDFGSATTVAYRCTDRKSAAKAIDDIEKNTTLMYRSPEMVDPWTKQRIDQKSDVWALGVLLYYLMYFKFPFEETALAIVNGKFSFPDLPVYPQALKDTVTMCLTTNPAHRPSIFDVVCAFCTFEELRVDSNILTPKEDPGFVQPLAAVCEESKPAGPTAAVEDPKAAGGLFGMLEWSGDGSSPGVAPASQPAPTQPKVVANQQEGPGAARNPRFSDLFVTAPVVQPAPTTGSSAAMDLFAPAPVSSGVGAMPAARGPAQAQPDLFAAWDGPTQGSQLASPSASGSGPNFFTPVTTGPSLLDVAKPPAQANRPPGQEFEDLFATAPNNRGMMSGSSSTASPDFSARTGGANFSSPAAMNVSSSSNTYGGHRTASGTAIDLWSGPVQPSPQAASVSSPSSTGNHLDDILGGFQGSTLGTTNSKR